MCMCKMQCAGWTLIILFLPTHADMQQQKKKLFVTLYLNTWSWLTQKKGRVGAAHRQPFVIYVVLLLYHKVRGVCLVT